CVGKAYLQGQPRNSPPAAILRATRGTLGAHWGHKLCDSTRPWTKTCEGESRYNSSVLAPQAFAGFRPHLSSGDPVSHCPSPRSPASVSWILPSMRVHAI